MTADSGDKGLALILQEQPAAAVVDYMLPGLSGLEVFRRVRQEHRGKSIKLIVFTADDDQQLRARCLQAGADDVIVKSAESAEIIRVVAKLVHS